MKRPETHDFLVSKVWLAKRQKIMRRDGYMCQYAKRYGKSEPGYIVHHIFPRSEFPEYALEDWNLITVSMKAHKTLEADGGLTDEGVAWLRRVARKRNIELPEKYQL